MKKCVLTVVMGDKYQKMSRLTVPLILDYCMRHNYDYVQLNNLWGHSSPVYTRFEIKRLLQEYDYILYTDVDIVFLPNCPDLLSLIEGDFDIAATPLLWRKFHEDFINDFCMKGNIDKIKLNKNIPYLCAGLQLVSRSYSKFFDLNLPETKTILEDQNLLNYAIQIGALNYKEFPIGVGASPTLGYCKRNDIKYIVHFNMAIQDEVVNMQMCKLIEKINNGTFDGRI